MEGKACFEDLKSVPTFGKEYTYSEPIFGSKEEFVGLVICVVMTFEILLYTITQ